MKSQLDEEEWIPPMYPQQVDAFYDDSKYLLLYGGRASGKSICALHKCVKHAYEHRDALVMVCTLTRAGSTAGGAWEDLLSMAEDHRGEPAGVLEIWAKGIGLVYTDEYGDKAGNKYIDIETADGGVSRIMQMSLPAASVVTNRIKTFKPSFFLFEELTNTSDSAYFYKVIQQLGRRRGVPQQFQQYVATCNPADEGRDHWVYKAFIENSDGPVTDPRYSVHVLNPATNPFMENKEEYLKSVEQEANLDPTAYDRLILGKWVARVVGLGMFEGFYDPEIHLKGELGKSGMVPLASNKDGSPCPIVVGYDPGDVNCARVFMQRHQLGEKRLYRYLDDHVRIKQRVSLEQKVRDVLDKMVQFNRRANHNFSYVHIGDNQGWEQYNEQGDLAYKRMLEISKYLIDRPLKGNPYKGLTPIYMRSPSKGPGSVENRVRMMKDMLLNGSILVSGTAVAIEGMFRKLREIPRKPDKPLKTASGEIHTFDAASYPVLYYEQHTSWVKGNISKNNLEIVSIPA
jgi:hypothetical protein